MEEKNITTRARELADAALVVYPDGNLGIAASDHNGACLGVHSRYRDPLFISLAAIIEAAMREAESRPREESFRKGRDQGLCEAHELIVQVAEGLTEAEGDAEVISRIVVALMRTAGALRSKAAG